jgi:hypothetical protein
MTPDYTIEISTKAKALIYREGDKVIRFEMDTRARPMVVYYHEFSNGSPGGLKTPLTDEVRDTICPRINRYFMKNNIAMKVTYEGLRTPRLSHLPLESKPPNKSPEPTAVDAVSSAIAVHAVSRRWLSFFR